MPVLLLTTRIDAPVDDCFRLSLSVDAHTASMGASAERAVAGVTSGELAAGDTVTWQARHFGLPLRMTSQITAYERPWRFVDEQVRGPFGRWWHEHRFESVEGTGTTMRDRVEFRSPLGPVGVAVDQVILRRYMRSLIETRNAWLKSALEG